MGVPDDDKPGGQDCHATVTEHVDGTRTCLLTPATVRDDADATRWVAASDGSFVSLDEMG